MWFTSLKPIPQAIKIPDAKAAVDKDGRCLRRYQPGNWQKSETRRRSYLKHKETKRKSTLLHWWTHVTSENAEWEPELQKYKGRVLLLETLQKTIPGAYAVFHWTMLRLRPQMTAAQIMSAIARLPGCDEQAAHATSVNTQVKNGGCSQNIENSKNRNVQTYGYAFQDIIGRNHCPVIKDPVVPPERNLYGHPWAGLLWKRQLLQVWLKLGWGKGIDLVRLLVDKKQGLFLSVYVDDITMTGKKQNITPHAEKKLVKNVWSWRTYVVLWSRVFGTYSTWMQTKCNYHWRIHENVWITYFCKSNGKNYLGG